MRKLGGVSEKETLESGDAVKESSEPSRDIQLFLKARFDDIKRERPMLIFPAPWPAEEDILQLGRLAAGLFILADTVLAYVVQKGEPISQLQTALRILGNTSDKAFPPISKLYAQILHDAYSPFESNNREYMHRLLAYLVWQKDPLPRVQLVKLLAPPEATAQNLVSIAIINLMPVITLTEPDGPVRVSHKSFLDFLTNRPASSTTTNTRAPEDEIDAFVASLSSELTRSNQCSPPRPNLSTTDE